MDGEIIQENNQFIACNQCVEGRYSLNIPDMQKDINKLQCVSCPQQAKFCKGSQIILKDGYWRENNLTDQIYTCLLESCAFDNPQSKSGCLTGYIGPLCNSCDSKQSVWGEQFGFRNKKCYPQIGLLITSSLSSSGNDISLLYKIFINYLQILSYSSNYGILSQHIISAPLNILGDPSKMLIQSLICIKIGSKYYLTADYSQECYDHYHLLYSLTVVVPLIIMFCFTIPYFLFKKLRYLQKKDSQNRLLYTKFSYSKSITVGNSNQNFLKEKIIDKQTPTNLATQQLENSTDIGFIYIYIQRFFFQASALKSVDIEINKNCGGNNGEDENLQINVFEKLSHIILNIPQLSYNNQCWVGYIAKLNIALQKIQFYAQNPTQTAKKKLSPNINYFKNFSLQSNSTLLNTKEFVKQLQKLEIKMYYTILVFSLGLKYIYSQSLQVCANQNRFYDLTSQKCGSCQMNCQVCSDFNSCLQCNQNSYYEEITGKCVEQCQKGQSQDNYFGLCIECQVQNCSICQFDGQLCEQCNQGWQLSIDNKYCLKSECIASNSFYNPSTNSCTTNCPESHNQQDKTCVSLKKLSQIKTLSSRYKVNQQDINYLFFFEQINEKPMIVTLDDSKAVLYTYPELIPLDQIEFINMSFFGVAKDSQNIYLIGSENVQKIDLIQQEINIIYSIKDKLRSFSQKQLFSITEDNQKINIFTFSTGQILTYQIQNQLIVKFNPQLFNAFTSKSNGDINSSILPQPTQNNRKLAKVELGNDKQGCKVINKPVQINPTKLNLNMIQKDFLSENIYQQNLKFTFQNSTVYLDNQNESFSYYQNEQNNIFLFDLSSNIVIQAQAQDQSQNFNILQAFKYDGKIRLVVINQDKYNGTYQSAVVCANLTQNLTSREYYFEYDKPHYAQTTQQLIQFIITDDKSSLILVSTLGYELINISTQLSMVVTESSQNKIYIFSNTNDNLFGHSKFISKNQSLYYQITQDNIQLHLLNFNNEGFSKNDQYQINLKSMEYPYFNIDYNQVQIINDQTTILSYTNQLIKINISTKNQNQILDYSRFTEQNSTYFLGRIQEILYSEDFNIIALIFLFGFRVIKVNGQRLLFEKNIRLEIKSAAIESQFLVLFYKKNDANMDFLVVKINNGQMYQYETPIGIVLIQMYKQKNPDRIFLSTFYPDSISLFCISQQKTDIFQINARPLLLKQNIYNQQNFMIQALNDNIYIVTAEYFILIFTYDSVNSQLKQIDNVYSKSYFNLINNNILITINQCADNRKRFSFFNRIQKQNFLPENFTLLSLANYMVRIINSAQYNKLLIYPLLLSGTTNFTIFDIDTYSNKTFGLRDINYYNDAYFLGSQNGLLLQLFSFNDLSNITLNVPQPFNIFNQLKIEFLQMQGATYIIVQNKTQQQYLFNIQSQQLTQIFLKSNQEKLSKIVQKTQVILYSDQNLVANYAFQINNFNLPDKPLQRTDYQNIIIQQQFSEVIEKILTEWYYFNFDVNQYLKVDVKNIRNLQNYNLIKNQQLFGINNEGFFEITDLQFNQLYLFADQSQVQYIKELDAFISLNKNKKVLFQKRKFFETLKVDVDLTDSDSLLTYKGVVISKNTILLHTYQNYKSKLYLFNYISEQIKFLEDIYQIYQNQFSIILSNDQVLIIDNFSILVFQIKENNQHQIICNQNLTLQFKQYYEVENLQLDGQSGLLLQSYLLQEIAVTLFRAFDYYQTLKCEQYFSNSLVQYYFLSVKIWTPIFSNLYLNSLKSYRNHFIFDQESNTLLNLNYNSNQLDIFSSKNNSIIHQFKFNSSLSVTQYFVHLYKMSQSTILAITSNTEIVIYDFIQNQQIKYLSSSFKCILFSNFFQDIYCLENNNILKKFDYALLDFVAIANGISIQIEISEFYALSQELLAFISLQGQIILLNPSALQISPIITSYQQIDKVQQIRQYFIILTQQQFLQVYNIQSQLNTLNLVQVFQYNRTGYEILDFLVITFNSQNTLIIAESVTIYAYNLQSNQLIGNLPTVCQKSLQLKQDDNYLYVICSFQISIFDKRVLKLINYKKINQFKYSNIRDVQHLYQDFFAFILYDDLIIVKLNSQSSQIVESFTKLDNPQIYQVNLIYQNQQQDTPYQIQLRCISDSNLFDITYEIQISNQQMIDTLINFVQSPSIRNNNFQHQDFQDRVSTQQLNIQKYIIQMTIQYSKLEQIQKFYEVFTEETIIEYQFNIQKDKLNLKGIANLTDSNFILKEFYILSFQKIILQINIKDTNFILNQFGNLKSLKFSNTDFVFDINSRSNLLISDLNTLILDSVSINDQEIYGNRCYNVSLSDFQFDSFKDITVLESNHYSVSDQLQYFSKQILIENIILKEIKFSLQKNPIFNITSIQGQLDYFNFTKIDSLNNLIILYIQNKINVSNSVFSNINLIEGSVISLIYGQLNLTRSSFINMTCSGSPCALNTQSSDLIQINNNNFTNLYNVQLKISLIKIKTYFQAGAIIISSAQQTFIENCLFQNCISQNEGGALSIQNSKQIFIENCQFKNCQAQKQGGALIISSTELTFIEKSQFQNCISQMDGGALYSLQQKQQNITIHDSDFIENKSNEGSGGAIFLSQIIGVNITKSNFRNNTAQQEKGGAISLTSSNLTQFSENNFSYNEARVGGSIYYNQINSELVDKTKLLQNQIVFLFNKASFYGQNIGSSQKYIGITNQPHPDSLKIVQEYSIHNIASGSYIDQKLYLNLFDEEKNPFNFFGSDTSFQNTKVQLQLQIEDNSTIIIQEGIYASLNKTIGMFELYFQSFYKKFQNQRINFISNQFDENAFLTLPLNLHYRNCIAGEIVQESNQFIACNQCVEGRYSLKIPDMLKDINKLQCISCPEQAKFCQGSQIILKDGYWRESNLTDQIYNCLLESCFFDNPESKSGCITGYVGPLCNSCDSKQTVWGLQYGLRSKKCDPCGQELNQILYLCFFILFYVFYITTSQQKIIKSKIQNIMLNIFKQIELLITSCLSSSGNDVSLLYKIFINYLQILACSSNFGIFSQPLFQASLNVLGDPINMTASTLDCLFKMSDNLICIKIGSKNYLTSDYSQECYDHYHLLYSLTVVVPLIIIFCLLIPYFLFSKLKYLQKKDQYNRLRYSKVGSIMTYGFLYTGYTSNFLNWEILALLEQKYFSRGKIFNTKADFYIFNASNNKEKSMIQNFQSQEMQSFIPSMNSMLNQINLQKYIRPYNSNLFQQYSSQKFMTGENSNQNQEKVIDKKIPTIQTQQIENSTDSGLVFEKEFSFVQIGQNFIFDNIIAANKFQQNQLDEKHIQNQ
ncbi:hypothetical protein ABPG72_021032 [Tetrahymena utriculariae]